MQASVKPAQSLQSHLAAPLWPLLRLPAARASGVRIGRPRRSGELVPGKSGTRAVEWCRNMLSGLQLRRHCLQRITLEVGGVLQVASSIPSLPVVRITTA